MRSDPTLKRWYNKVNHKFFDNYLPCDTCVRWSNEDDREEDERCEEKYNGWTNLIEDEGKPRFLIVISNTLRKSLCTKVHTLTHEMCHVATGVRDNHGAAFEKWRQTIADKGIFKKGAVIKRLTIF